MKKKFLALIFGIISTLIYAAPFGLKMGMTIDEIAELLIKAGAKITLKNSLGYTELYMAVNGQNLEMMKLLIDNGADINEKDNFHDTILMNAVRENFVDGINREIVNCCGLKFESA